MNAAKVIGLALAGGLAVAAVVGSSAQAVDNWTPFFMIKQGVVYIDRNSVEHSEDKVSLASELWFETPENLRGQLVNYIRSKINLNCTAHTYVVTEQTFVGMDGQIIGRNLTPTAPTVPPSGTFESALMSAYCPKKS